MNDKYEAVFIIKSYMGKELINDTIHKINKVIEQYKCKLTATQKLGVRKIVTPKYGFGEGFYYHINFEPTNDEKNNNVENEIKRTINTIEPVIMCVIVKMENN